MQSELTGKFTEALAASHKVCATIQFKQYAYIMVVMNIGKDATLFGFAICHDHLVGFFIAFGVKNFDGLLPGSGVGQGIFTIIKGRAGLLAQFLNICRSIVHNVCSLLNVTVVFYSDTGKKYSYLCPFFGHPSA